MKNLLTYINPSKEFNEENKKLIKIQIDNSLNLGWDKKDILIVTNFEYEYNGVRSFVVGDEHYCLFHWPATKIYVITYLFNAGLIEKGLYWYHDFDCYQLAPFLDVESDLGSADIGLTRYGNVMRICSASIFFKETAGDIFEWLKKDIENNQKNEENRILNLIGHNKVLSGRIKLLNVTYAFHRFNIRSCYKKATKPIKAAHFHLSSDKYNFFVKGDNKLQIPFIPKGLIKIFNTHGFIDQG